MRIAVAQVEGRPGDIEANLEVVRRRAAEAASAGARLVVFPEAFVTGYAIGPDLLLALAEPAGGEQERVLREIAAGAGIAVAIGLPELDGDTIFNAAVLVDREGEVRIRARKTHLYGALDRAAFCPGDALAPVADVDGLHVGLLVCYDIEFPETVRTLAGRGAQLVAVPTALMQPSAWIADTLVPARAAENQLYVAYANRVGVEGELIYTGGSCVAGPAGGVQRARGDAEALLLADVDPDAIARARRRHDYLAERRPGLYDA